MSKRKQKIVLEGFTFTVGKLIIEHESEDFEIDELSENVRTAIGEVISAPARLLSPEAGVQQTPPTPAVVQSVAAPKRRRRRSSPPTTTADGQQNGERTTRTKPNSARSLIEEMKNDGFFAQDRSISEVREELHTRGHSFKSNEISPILLAMTKQKDLSRRKDDSGSWVYRAG